MVQFIGPPIEIPERTAPTHTFPARKALIALGAQLHFANNWWSLLYSVDLDVERLRPRAPLEGSWGNSRSNGSNRWKR